MKSSGSIRRVAALRAITCLAFTGVASRSLDIANAANAIPLRIGAMPIDAAAEVFYAQDMGFFKAAGLDVQLTVLNNGASIIPAVAASSLDVGFGATPPVILARERGIAIRFIAPANVYSGPPSSGVLVVAKDSPIRSAADLNGKTIAIGGLNDLLTLTTEVWVDKNGGDSKSVHFIEIPYAQMGVALTQGRVSAACLLEPFTTAIKPVARMLVENLNGVIGSPYLLAGWYAVDDWLRRNPDSARRFAAVMQRTARWANTHHEESAAILVRYSKITNEIAEKMQRVRYPDDSLGVDPKNLDPVIAVMTKYGGLKSIGASDLVWETRVVP